MTFIVAEISLLKPEIWSKVTIFLYLAYFGSHSFSCSCDTTWVIILKTIQTQLLLFDFFEVLPMSRTTNVFIGAIYGDIFFSCKNLRQPSSAFLI